MKYILLILAIELLFTYPFAIYFYHSYVILSRTMSANSDFKLEKRAPCWKKPSYSIFKLNKKNFISIDAIVTQNGFPPFQKIPNSQTHAIPNELEKQLDHNPISLNKNIVVTKNVLSKKVYSLIYDKNKESLYDSLFRY